MKEQKTRSVRKTLTIEALAEGVLERKTTMLARAITLIESGSEAHREQAQKLIERIMPHAGKSIRIGMTGAPGAGKSTFIEALGMHVIEQGSRVAVLAVDPSSQVSGGSILGDKTRMEKLSRSSNSFIRPSPSRGELGGVAEKTRETILLCEAAGFDVIIVETVGVGQSEFLVRGMVDFFLLLQIAGSGDELQGIKRGVIEMADAIVVNKADGDNKTRAQAARQELATALRYLTPATARWKTKALTASALTGEGVPEIWRLIEKFHEAGAKNDAFEKRRGAQARAWMHESINSALSRLFWTNEQVRRELEKLETKVTAGKTSPSAAAKRLLKVFGENK